MERKAQEGIEFKFKNFCMHAEVRVSLDVPYVNIMVQTVVTMYHQCVTECNQPCQMSQLS